MPSDITTEAPRRFDPTRFLKKPDFAVTALLALPLGVALLLPGQLPKSATFVADALFWILPFFVLSIAMAAYAEATGADGLIKGAFEGRAGRATILAALAGALSPFCSCGVIPMIAALMRMGVPLAPIMAFWLASPLMDPTMFMITAGLLGPEFAAYKTFAAFGTGLIGGFGVIALGNRAAFAEPLRVAQAGSCCSTKKGGAAPIAWRFWQKPERVSAFKKNAVGNTFFLGKWLLLAFFIESLMVSYVPADMVAQLVGGGGVLTIALAAFIGMPAYLNGYAALPLISGLIDQGMSPAAGMAFLLGGGVTSIPAMIAVFALAKRQVFAAYLVFALTSAILFGLGYTLFA